MQHSDRLHARLSASGSDRWLNCQQSVRKEEGYKNTSSIYAEEGTLAHELADIELRRWKGGMDEAQFESTYEVLMRRIGVFNDTFKTKISFTEMQSEVAKYVDVVIEEFNILLAQNEFTELFVEQKLDLTEVIPEGFGTGDAVIVSDGLMVVCDLKYGKGVEVDATENSQLMLYGFGAYMANKDFYFIDRVKVMVIQPRINNVSSFEISVKDLLDWAYGVVKPTAELAMAGKGELKSGKWCKFCKAKADCSQYAEDSMRTMQLAFYDEYEPESPDTLNMKQIAFVLKNGETAKQWVDAVFAKAKELLLDGKEIEGYKLVEGRSVRTISDEEGLVAKLNELEVGDIYKEPKLKGITDLEKLVGKKVFNVECSPYIAKPKGKPAIAPESDKRQALELSTIDASSFDDGESEEF